MVKQGGNSIFESKKNQSNTANIESKFYIIGNFRLRFKIINKWERHYIHLLIAPWDSLPILYPKIEKLLLPVQILCETQGTRTTRKDLYLKNQENKLQT